MELDPYCCEGRSISYDSYKKALEVIEDCGCLDPYECEKRGIPYEEYVRLLECVGDDR